MRARDAMFMVFMGVILTLAVGGYLFYELRQDDESSEQQSVSTDTSNPTRSSAVTAAQQPALQQPSQSSQSLQVQGMSSSPAQPSTPALPTPAQFGEYEQYATNDSILYIDEVVGNGDVAANGDRVAMLYSGWLTDGTLFDQTKANEQGQIQPFVFQIGAGQVISGWDTGIAGMKVGGKRRLVLPSAFGYGPSGQGSIPPNAMLVFDVELVGVEPSALAP